MKLRWGPQKRVNLKMWGRVIELYDEAAHQGISLSPGVYYDLMRAAVLVASSGRPEALGFAEHCLQEMSHLGARAPPVPPPLPPPSYSAPFFKA